MWLKIIEVCGGLERWKVSSKRLTSTGHGDLELWKDVDFFFLFKCIE